MTLIRMILTGPEEAYDNHAELWCGNEQVGITVLHEGRVHLRIDPRRDGEPWLIDALSLATSLRESAERIATY